MHLWPYSVFRYSFSFLVGLFLFDFSSGFLGGKSHVVLVMVLLDMTGLAASMEKKSPEFLVLSGLYLLVTRGSGCYKDLHGCLCDSSGS